MSQESMGAGLPTVRLLEDHQPLVEINGPSANLPSPTEAEALAVEGVFAEVEEEHVAVVDAFTLAATGMLLRDIAIDTLMPKEEDEEEKDAKKSQEPKKE